MIGLMNIRLLTKIGWEDDTNEKTTYDTMQCKTIQKNASTNNIMVALKN